MQEQSDDAVLRASEPETDKTVFHFFFVSFCPPSNKLSLANQVGFAADHGDSVLRSCLVSVYLVSSRATVIHFLSDTMFLFQRLDDIIW